MSLVTGLFFPVLLLNQRWSPPLRLQASHCSTFRIMCDVPSIAVFCSESIECFQNFSLSFSLLFQWPQLLLVQSYISGSTFAVSLHTNSCILTSFPLPFAQHCLRILPHLSVSKFSPFVFNYYSWPNKKNKKENFYLLLLLLLLLCIVIRSLYSSPSASFRMTAHKDDVLLPPSLRHSSISDHSQYRVATLVSSSCSSSSTLFPQKNFPCGRIITRPYYMASPFKSPYSFCCYNIWFSVSNLQDISPDSPAILILYSTLYLS